MKIAITDYTLIYANNRRSAEFKNIAYKLANGIGALVGENAVPIKAAACVKAFEKNEKQILFGETGYPETESVKNGLAYDEYIWKITENKVVIFGYSNETLRLAAESFLSYATVEGQDLNYSIIEKKEKREGWFEFLPKYKGGIFRGATHSGSDNFIGVVNNTNISEYEAYAAELRKIGYKLKRRAEKLSMVSDIYIKDGSFVHIYFLTELSQTRIVTGKTCMLMEESPALEAITTPMVSQVNIDPDRNGRNFCGMGFIITLADGRFIIVDGGKNRCKDAETMYNLLKTRNKRKDGKIIIATWIITHNHVDHSACFIDFTNNHVNTGEIILEQLVYSVFSLEQCYESERGDDAYCLPKATNWIRELTESWEGARFCIPLTGDVLDIGGVKVEIMLTNSDWYPEYMFFDNDSSTAFRISANEKSVLFIGDNEIYGAHKMLDMYTDEDIKSYAVQMGHHGKGSDVFFYRAVDAEIYFYAGPQDSFDKHCEDLCHVTGRTIKHLALDASRFRCYTEDFDKCSGLELI